MNPWQMAQQIKKELQAVAWPGGAAEVVFGLQAGQVRVVAGAPTEDQMPTTYPAAWIVMGDGSPDEDHPELIDQNFRIITGAQSYGDKDGEHSIIGGPSPNLGASDNRGILEIAERVRNAIGDLTGADGAKMQLVATALDTPFAVGPLSHITFDDLTVAALCTTDLNYDEPQQLVRAGTAWSWQGTHISDRFDFRRYTLGYKAGTTVDDAAATLADITTTVYQNTTAATTHTAVSGQVYSVFAEYNARSGTGGSTTDGSSAGNRVGAFVIEA